MKVLLVNHFPLVGSGSGVYTHHLALGLLRLGHRPMVIAPSHRRVRGLPYAVRNILFADGGRKGRDLAFNFPCFTTHPASSLTFRELKEGQIHRYVETFHRFTDRAVDDFQPDLIHAQHIWVAAYAASGTGLPYLVTCHGTDLIGFRECPRYRSLARTGARRAAVIVAVSRQVAAEVMKRYRLPESRVKVIYNGIDTKLYRPRRTPRRAVLASLGIGSRAKYVVSFVGKLAGFKGVDTLIRAAAAYEGQLPDVVTLIVGEGELLGALRSLTERLGLKNVYFVGHQPPEVVARIYNIADLSVVPSRGEPFGLVALEALACGTPVVASRAGGLVEFVSTRVGALFEVDDYQGLAALIVRQICSRAKQRKGTFASRYAHRNFSWEKQTARMVRLYEEVLAGRP